MRRTTDPPNSEGRRLQAQTRILLIACCTVFLVHALSYSFFFVDDEAIPFVFARNLIRGKGLVYNSFEGRVEGYSDFLHVLISAVWLQVAAVAGLGRLAPFFMGKAVSFAAGVGTVLLAGSALRRTIEIRVPGLAAGLAFLVLFPPLARWSCSSLEMATVTLLVMIVTIGLLEVTPRWDRALLAAACTLVLLRIDGVVFVAALLVPALIAARADRRWALVRTAVVPVVAVFAVYHAWRVWYFGDWLPCPLAAKVLYKLHADHDIATRPPRLPYAVSFATMYGVVPAAVGLAFVVASSMRFRRAWPLMASACLLAGYAAVVGDWMAGFRFFLPLAPVATVLVALAVSSIRRPVIAWTIAAAAATWFGAVAVGSARTCDHPECGENWWRHPSFDERRFFGHYLRLYEDLSGIVKPGSMTAYNQAGFVPYMLDVDNLDDLGICSRFVARMPTTDVVFTEVGRYSPLTNSTALRAAHAYVLYRQPDFIIEPLDNLRSANGGAVPSRVLRDHYTLQLTDPNALAAVYRRTTEPLGEFQSNPRTFLENLATPSRLVSAYDGDVIPRGQFLSRLPFLADGTLNRRFAGHVRYDVIFGTADQPVYELHVQRVWARTAASMTITLRNTAGAVVGRDERTLSPGRAEHLSLFWPGSIRACELSLELTAASPEGTRVILRDLRVQGQSPALAAHVAQLAFPPSTARQPGASFP